MTTLLLRDGNRSPASPRPSELPGSRGGGHAEQLEHPNASSSATGAGRGGSHRHPLRRAVDLLEVDWGRFRWAVFLGTVSLGSAVGLSAVAAWLIARASQMPPVLELSVAVVMVRAFGISRGVFRYLERLVSHDVALRGMTALRVNLYERLAAGRIEAVAGLRRGELLARVGTDVDAVGDFVVRGLLPAGIAASVSVLSVVLVAWVLPLAGLVLLLCAVLAGIVAPWLSARAAREQERRTAEARAAMTATSLELLEAAGPLTLAGQVPVRLELLRASDRALSVATDASAHTTGVAGAIGVWAQGIAVLAALALGIPQVSAGTLDPLLLPVIVLLPLAAFEAFVPLAAAAVQLHRSGHAAARILSMLDAAGVERAPDSEEAIEHAPTVVARELSCGWPARPPVLDGVDLEVSPGKVLAVVGPSGVGKSTLLMTLAGLLPPTGGRLSVVSAAASSASPQRLGFFSAEDAHVFETSVFENLRVVRGDLTHAEARAALAWAGLSEWLGALPEGLETLLGPDGSSISGGERRRLLLARVRLSTRPLLFVDEPAEHLDAETADEMAAALMALAREDAGPDGVQRGLVLATHRLSALAAADEVVLLGHAPGAPHGASAQVVARGTHAELLASLPAYRWALEQERAKGGEGIS